MLETAFAISKIFLLPAIRWQHTCAIALCWYQQQAFIRFRSPNDMLTNHYLYWKDFKFFWIFSIENLRRHSFDRHGNVCCFEKFFSYTVISMTVYLYHTLSLTSAARFYNISITELYIVNNLYVLHVFFNLIYSCNDKHLSEQLCVLEMVDNILLFSM